MPAFDFEFVSPQRIIFGWGRRRELAAVAGTLGCRAWGVVGSRTLLKNGTWDALATFLRDAGLDAKLAATIAREPEVEDVDRLVATLRKETRPGDFVIGLGGGSAIDLAKAAAALTTNRQGSSVRDFLEGVGKSLAVTEPPLPMIAMPTTGGTGTEATKNAVISSYDPPFKKSLRSPRMVPPVVLVDPELSVSVPPATTAWTGMDAITQCIESFISRFATPWTQALAVEGLRNALPNLVHAVRQGDCRPAREAMAYAALLSGMALANSGLGLAHGVAAALGACARVPHGQACAIMLPVALRVNRTVAQAAFATLARRTLAIEDRNDATASARFIHHIEELCHELKVPTRLSEVDVQPQQLDSLVRGSRGNSMNGNPRQLDDSELRDLLEAML